MNSIDRLLSVSQAARSFIDANLDRIARVDRAPVSAINVSTSVGRWEKFEGENRTYLLTTLSNGTLQSLMPLSLNYRMSDDYKPRFGRTVIRGDLWKGFHQDMGNVAKEGDTAFSNGKKPVRLIKQLIRWANNTRDGIVLDFFAGSGTTAHAVLQANAEDSGHRRFIMVQLDEVPDPKSEVAKARYRTIAELSRDRIRRAGMKIQQEAGLAAGDMDIGFRTFKIDSTNMADVLRTPDETGQEVLTGLRDSVRSDRSGEDLLFQVLLDWGLDLTMTISVEQFDGREVFVVEDDVLIACFDESVSPEVVRSIAKCRPLRAVFRDSGFDSDADRINAEQVFREFSPSTDVKVI